VCGILGTNLKSSVSDFERSLKNLSNRGPDNIDYKLINDFRFGHARLSIIDLNKNANQPMTIDDYTILFNGEIYNYNELLKKYQVKSLTNSDTEALLRLYILRKEKILEELDGMFAFSVYNEFDKSLFLARDSIGEKPLYYYDSNKELVYSSSITSIQMLINDLTISSQSIYDFFSFSWIPEPDTIFNEIKALPKSSYATYSGNALKIDQYSFNYQKKYQNNIEETRNLVEESINRRLMSDVKLGCFLSGGLDSSIVSLVSSKNIDKIDLFSIGFEDDICPYTGFADETKFAKEVASNIDNCVHHIIRVSESDYSNLLDEYIEGIDQPFAISSSLGILAISQHAKEHGVKVLLSGDGADECFGGYSWYPKLKYNNTKFFSEDKPKGWHYLFLDSEKNNILSSLITDNIKPSTRYMISNYLESDPKEFIEHDKYFYLSNEMMTKLDRMTMSYSIEGRSIFVSPKILKFTDNISYNDLMKNGEKWILKEAFKSSLPDLVLNRSKHGFNTPMHVWFSNKWKVKLESIFDKNSYLNKLGILNTSFEHYFDTFKNDKRFGGLSFNLLVLELWLQQYCKDRNYKVI
jgi:asparagine synthase (glutamine-hydrolysing)